nr:AAA family ATPase [Microscillaceae bacterium]
QSIAECFEWFDKILVIVFPHYTYRGLVLDLMNNTQVIDMFCNFLTLFNTGISGVEIQDEDVENLDLPNHLKKEIISGMQKQSIGTIELAKKSYFVFKNEFNEIKYYKLMTKHYLKSTHEAVLFEVEDESDGTQRLFDLIPVLINLVNKECVFLVDELDRSLHANLARTLIEVFLKNSQDVDSQLIATTHESHLLDLDLLRRDEIWFVEKNKAGESKLYSLEEFQPRYDKEIRKDYLVGRYGAIPFIGNVDNLKIRKL